MSVKVDGPTWGSPQAVSVLLVPPLLALLAHPSADARKGALQVLNLMLPSMPDGMVDNIGAPAGRGRGVMAGLGANAEAPWPCLSRGALRALPLPRLSTCPPCGVWTATKATASAQPKATTNATRPPRGPTPQPFPWVCHHATESFTQGLFQLATDTDSGVRKQVVAGLVGLLPIRPDLLMPQLHQIIEYMLAMHQVGLARLPCCFSGANRPR
jgi:hypothetical protein